jgi:hypothetical protein
VRAQVESPAGAAIRPDLKAEIDLTVRERAPAGWKGDQAREAQVLNRFRPEPLRALIGAFEAKSCVLREPELKGGGGAGRASEAMRSPWSRARRTPPQLLFDITGTTVSS